MKLEDITKDLNLSGIEPSQIVTVVATVPLRDESLQVIYRTPEGQMKERLLGRSESLFAWLPTTMIVWPVLSAAF